MIAPTRSILCWAPCLGAILLLVPISATALTEAGSSVDLGCTDGQPPSVTVAESGPTPLSETREDSVDFGASGTRSARRSSTSAAWGSP